MLILKMVISEEISLKKHIKTFITRSETGILHMSISYFCFMIGFRFVSIFFIIHLKTNWKRLQLSCASNTSSRWETGTWQYNVQGKTFTGHSINSFFWSEIKSSQSIFESKVLRATNRSFSVLSGQHQQPN